MILLGYATFAIRSRLKIGGPGLSIGPRSTPVPACWRATVEPGSRCASRLAGRTGILFEGDATMDWGVERFRQLCVRAFTCTFTLISNSIFFNLAQRMRRSQLFVR